MLVASVGNDASARADFKHGSPHGYEQLCLVAFTQLLVSILQSLSGALAVLQMCLDQYPRDHHEQSGGHTLAGHVRDHQS